MKIRHTRINLGIALAFLMAVPVNGANWAGSIRCELSSTATGYSHRETQTWTLTGGAPARQGAFNIYPATWVVDGQGTHDRTRNTNRRVTTWTASVQLPNAPISFHVTPAGQLMVQLWHSQLSSPGGYTGTDQYFFDSVPQAEGRLAATVYEWQPQKREVSPSMTQITGSQTMEVKGQLGPLQPPEAQAMVTCTWALGQGSAPPLPPASPGSGSSAGTSTPPTSTPPGTSTPPPVVPKLTGIAPASLEQGVSVSEVITLTGEGTHWKAGETRVNLGQGTTNQQLNVTSPTSLTLTATVSVVAAAGVRPVTVTTGSEVVTLPDALTIVARGSPPTTEENGLPRFQLVPATSVEQGSLSNMLALVGEGTHWQYGATTVSFGPRMVLAHFEVLSPAEIAVKVAPDFDATPGPRDVIVTTGNEVLTLRNALTIVAREKPEIASISPNVAPAGTDVTVTFTGRGTRWAQGKTELSLRFAEGFSQVGALRVESPTRMTATLRIDPTAAPGPRQLSALNKAGELVADIIVVPNAFTVTAATPLHAFEPNDRPRQAHTVADAMRALRGYVKSDQLNAAVTGGPADAVYRIKISEQVKPAPGGEYTELMTVPLANSSSEHGGSPKDPGGPTY